MKYAIQSLIAGLLVVGLQGCNPTETDIPTKKPSSPPYTCALAKDHNPPLDPEADKYFQEARALKKPMARKIGLKLLASMKKPLR